ncbi:restriction endonuclease subunit S [Photobacterium toruni]|uniref:Restriction endonuclease subunit S n=1 Tax=Photobacterium toruni TaxID=1935446 RepID=A0ABU6L3D5_9GAMM|nr:restriction endonuclease subunit S [Photobacterium toruni]
MTVESLITQHIDTWTSAVKTKSTSGRGSRKKLDLYGIKKLRELILELAVRGKLVPQNPNDEPASVLLERIAKEKTQLVKDKKISKQKKLPKITEDEKLEKLPEGWQLCRFGELYNLEYGDNLPKTKRSESGEYPVYGSNGIVGSHSKFSVNKGCVVVGRKGSAGALNKSITSCWVTDVAYSITPPTGITLDYCFLHLSTFGLDTLGKGIKPGLNRNDANILIACIPPTEEQHRIVAKVDELMTLCDQLEQQTEANIEAHQLLVSTLLNTLTNSANADELMENWTRISDHFDTLFTTEESIDQLKQTILQLAVMGKLVPQDPNDEPASVLLERIAEEKAQLLKDGILKNLKKAMVHEATLSGENKPNGWEAIDFGDITFNLDAKRIPLSVSERKGRQGEYDYYGASGVIDTINDYLFDKSLLLIGEDGANLVNRSTPIAFIARGKYWVNNHAHVIDGINEDFLIYLSLYINSISLIPYITGMAQPKMNQAKMNSILVLLPPENEQRRIIAKVDELMILCEHLKVRLKKSQTTQLHLTDAIVEQAI